MATPLAPILDLAAVDAAGIVVSWSEPAGIGTILSDAGSMITFTRAAIHLVNPSQARRYPSLAAVSLKVGQRVYFHAVGADAIRVMIDPSAPHL